MKGLKFTLGGIPVTVEPSFLLIAAMFGFAGGDLTLLLTWVPVVFVSVLVHELGHAVTYRIYGKQPTVVLQGMGGLTFGSALPFGRDIVVSLAGPLTGMILLGLPAYLLERSGPASGTVGLVIREVVFANVVWSVVNLLPVLPLDGGNVAASLLRRFKGPLHGQQAARVLSFVIAGVAGLYAYQIGFTFGALFAAFFAIPNFLEWRNAEKSGEQEPLVPGYRALLGNDLDTATRVADEVLAAKPSSAVVASAVELKAWAGFCSGGAAAAGAALEEMPAGVRPNAFLTGSLALDAGRTAEALDHYAEAFSRSQSGPWSIIVAEAVARCGQVDELVARLLATPAAGVDAVVHLQSHLHHAGRFPEAAAAGRLAFENGAARPAHVAYDVACSWARAAKPDDALDWLEKAADAGLADPALLDGDTDLASIRNTDRFRVVHARVHAVKADPAPVSQPRAPKGPPVL